MTYCRELEIEDFLLDVKRHVLTVLRDEGVYRHLRFKAPETGVRAFDIVTWPGHLAYTGDMGTYVFSRIEDMFEFFRSPPGRPFSISFDYWAEKCLAVDKCDGIRVYSPERAEEELMDWMENWPRIIREQAMEDLSMHMENERDLRDAVASYRTKTEDDAILYDFHDFWETDLMVYTSWFLWCCHALSWAVAQYDAAKG